MSPTRAEFEFRLPAANQRRSPQYNRAIKVVWPEYGIFGITPARHITAGQLDDYESHDHISSAGQNVLRNVEALSNTR